MGPGRSFQKGPAPIKLETRAGLITTPATAVIPGVK